MIFDHLKYLERYKGLHANLDLAIDFLVKHDVSQDDMGRHEINGDKVFYFIQENTLAQEKSQEFEFHKRYLDLHFLLEGCELIRYGTEIDVLTQAYDAEVDFASSTAKAAVDTYLTSDNFVAYFPEELHQPNRYAGQGEKVRKCVVKVLMVD